MRASVVIPVFNPGRYLDACIESLRHQTLPQSAWEAVFVDDGSSDGSGARLDQLAAELPNVRVAHIPNSGWPGRPRNVGLDMAVGQFVLFCDHDDWLGDEALERMVAMADRTGADVVVGREVGHGRGVPLKLFRRNVDDARLGTDPLLRLLTPHKLFRRSMLIEHAIRFPEGRRRFEDHVFVLAAYFAARRISILADYPCYHWITREGWANASDIYADPKDYYRDLRAVLDVVDANTDPGPFRDRLTSHWYRRRCLDRLRGERWADGPSAHDLDVFEEVRGLARERIGPGVVASLPLSHRLRSSSVTTGRPDLVSALARVETGLRARVRVPRLERDGAWLRVVLGADLLDTWMRPMCFQTDGDRTRWRPPDPVAGSFFPDDLDVTEDLRHATASLVFRLDDGALQHEVPATVERTLRETDHGPVLSIRARAEVDLRTAAAGNELPPGSWELLADVEVCGWHSRRRLPHVGVPAGRNPVRLSVSSAGGIGLVVGHGSPRPMSARQPARRRSGPHQLERYLPRPILQLMPLPVRRIGKRLLLRLRG